MHDNLPKPGKEKMDFTTILNTNLILIITLESFLYLTLLSSEETKTSY